MLYHWFAARGTALSKYWRYPDPDDVISRTEAPSGEDALRVNVADIVPEPSVWLALVTKSMTTELGELAVEADDEDEDEAIVVVASSSRSSLMRLYSLASFYVGTYCSSVFSSLST